MPPAPAAADPLLRFRSRFPILADTTYLISNSLGAMPEETERDLLEYARTWKTRGVRAWAETWWDLAREVGDIVGVARQRAERHGVDAPERDDRRGDRDLGLRLVGPAERRRLHVDELPLGALPLRPARAARAAGASPRCPSRDGIGVPTEAMLAAIDERTLLVPDEPRALPERLHPGREGDLRQGEGRRRPRACSTPTRASARCRWT